MDVSDCFTIPANAVGNYYWTKTAMASLKWMEKYEELEACDIE